MTPTVQLGPVLEAAAQGRFPPVDGGWELASPWSDRVEAIVALTGHAYIAVRDDVAPSRLHELGVDGFGGAHDPRVIHALAGPHGWIDSLDVILVRTSAALDPAVHLVPRDDLAGHPRAAFAGRVRDDLRVLGTTDRSCGSLVTLGRGLAGMTEIGVEVDADGSGPSGGELIEAAVVGVAGPVVAAVAPGNARALRTFLRCGFVPVGSVQLWVR
ncbi:N-acetyltransferase [Luteipulveratus mongoliensis]|uniref:N-acetyltransferase domain-containing protein n=1 Tax=Luteipulveratus mongoliensis TaxID=571913 RepID=A0A0K1JJQ6_9MICO|nr:N-acetyltransferase [Luteipulveratus mongoliensis]AKU16941.1 hypothetical protein VV02_15550 [Luteipulveratus mongoliensis]